MRASRLKRPDPEAGFRRSAFFLFAVVLLFSACRTPRPLPPADFSASGWRLQEGQAVWKPSRSRPELSGEILFATRANGDFLVQFSKPPFTLVTAQLAGDQWQIEFGHNERRWSGRGAPRSRFAWFELRRALTGEPLSPHWRFSPSAGGSWRIENTRTGEWLEGGFHP